MAETEGSTGINWQKAVKSLGIAVLLYFGGATGSYVAQAELQKETAIFRLEIKETLKNIDARLGQLEKGDDES